MIFLQQFRSANGQWFIDNSFQELLFFWIKQPNFGRPINTQQAFSGQQHGQSWVHLSKLVLWIHNLSIPLSAVSTVISPTTVSVPSLSFFCFRFVWCVVGWILITNWFLHLVMKQHRRFFWEQLDNLKSQGGMHLLSDVAWKDGESLGFLGQQPHKYATDWKASPRLYYHQRVVLPPKSIYKKIVCTECHVPSSYATRATNTIWLTSFYWLHLATNSYTELCFDQALHLGDLHWTHWLIPSLSF